jgi:hypothetical protein
MLSYRCHTWCYYNERKRTLYIFKQIYQITKCFFGIIFTYIYVRKKNNIKLLHQTDSFKMKCNVYVVASLLAVGKRLLGSVPPQETRN